MDKAAVRLRLAHAGELAVIALAAAGDDVAFDELIRRNHSRVRNFMRRLCNQPDGGRSGAAGVSQNAEINRAFI